MSKPAGALVVKWRKLAEEGLVQRKAYRGVFLTEKGSELAEKVEARHQLVLSTLLALGVPPHVAEADSEGIEHHCSDATVEAMQRFLEAHDR